MVAYGTANLPSQTLAESDSVMLHLHTGFRDMFVVRLDHRRMLKPVSDNIVNRPGAFRPKLKLRNNLMAYATHTEQTFAGTSLWQSLSTLKASLAYRLARYRIYRETVEELAALSDRELADVGLYRANIRAVAREAVHAI